MGWGEGGKPLWSACMQKIRFLKTSLNSLRTRSLGVLHALTSRGPWGPFCVSTLAQFFGERVFQELGSQHVWRHIGLGHSYTTTVTTLFVQQYLEYTVNWYFLQPSSSSVDCCRATLKICIAVALRLCTGGSWAGFRPIFWPKNLIFLSTTAIYLNFLDSYWPQINLVEYF